VNPQYLSFHLRNYQDKHKIQALKLLLEDVAAIIANDSHISLDKKSLKADIDNLVEFDEKMAKIISETVNSKDYKRNEMNKSMSLEKLQNLISYVSFTMIFTTIYTKKRYYPRLILSNCSVNRCPAKFSSK